MADLTNADQTNADQTNAATNIDPRFDPAFQRGFGETVGTTRRRPPVGTPSVVPAQEAVPRPVVVAPAPRTAMAPDTADDAFPGAARTPASTPEDEPEARGATPFVIALAVIGAVLILAGLAGATFATTVFSTNLTSTISYVTVLLVISGSAVSIGVGVATLIGIVFLFALRRFRS